MKRGPKPQLPSTMQDRGTFRADRHGDRLELIEPDALPREPEWLTPAGKLVWLDDIGRVADGKLVNERDTSMFANYCNLQGAIVEAWKSAAVPPAAHLMEARKLAEQFGIFGAKSRMKMGGKDGASKNPFARNGVRI